MLIWKCNTCSSDIEKVEDVNDEKSVAAARDEVFEHYRLNHPSMVRALLKQNDILVEMIE